jgi:molybdopterin converting factor small subunit
MSHVVVRLPAALRPLADGATELHVPAGTLADVINSVGDSHPSLRSRLLTPEGGLRPYVNVFVGTVNVRDLQGLGTVVPDGAEVCILPAVAGG